MKRIFVIFCWSFLLNLVWENSHSFLYNNYMGGKITEFILIRAAFFDALLISLLVLPFLYFPYLKNKSWLIIVVGTLVSIFNEWYGLGAGRWAYNSFMPILPIIKVGLTPTIQLGLLAYLSYKLRNYFSSGN